MAILEMPHYNLKLFSNQWRCSYAESCGASRDRCTNSFNDAASTAGTVLATWLIVVIVFAVICPIAIIVGIVLCVVCCARGNKGKHTTTVVTTAPAPAPVVETHTQSTQYVDSNPQPVVTSTSHAHPIGTVLTLRYSNLSTRPAACLR